MKKLIKQFKKLNKDSATYGKLKRSLDKKYNYLRIISPIRREMKTNQIFLIDKNDNIFKPTHFSNRCGFGNVILKGEYIGRHLNNFSGELVIQELPNFKKISRTKVEELLLTKNKESFLDSSLEINKIFHKNATLISEFIGGKKWKKKQK